MGSLVNRENSTSIKTVMVLESYSKITQIQKQKQKQKQKETKEIMIDKLAVVMAAHNEELVLDRTLTNLTRLVNPKNIYIISDGSKDRTEEIALSYGVNVHKNEKNLGKTMSLRAGLERYKILKRYKFVFFLDADSSPDKNFFTHALKHFSDPEIASVCGQVVSDMKSNVFVAYRSVMYYIWQNLYKAVCSRFDAVPISPGMGSIYRTKALRQIEFDKKIIIEDFDMTFQVHRKKLGKIIFDNTAHVYTQDPDNFKDYYKQITRWQLGFFQAARKHRVPHKLQPFDIAISVLMISDIIHSIFLVLTISTLLIVAMVYVLFKFWSLPIQIVTGGIVFLIFDIWLISGFCIVHDIVKRKAGTFYMGPLLWGIQFISIAAFIKALYQTYFKNINGAWVSPTRRSA